jgi:3-deoxy-manno-octulosonate cytidylyltransferase (CMP-KDO synthetase)
MANVVVIPARLASSRLPNKPLADICGTPMIVRVAQRVIGGLEKSHRVVVAADHPSIVQVCTDHGVAAILTSTKHQSGSDRIAEACDLLELAEDDIVVNVQGDEPLIEPSLVAQVADLLQTTPQADMSTAAHSIKDWADYINPNVVKVVLDANRLAMYFSRAPIAWSRDSFAAQSHCLPQPAPLRHVGIYAYRTAFLRVFPTLAQAPVELVESLEQLRAMWHGYKIAVHTTSLAPGPGVDTAEDLERVRTIFKSMARDSL